MVKEIRQLAAVMFADIVGFTTMMQQDEERARTLRIRHRQVIDEAVAEHAGLVMQTYGDGTLIVFSSAVDAARCAIAVQTDLRADPAVPLRIGIHMGDVVYDEDGIYGDCVNIASRIESLCVPGAVLLSGKLNDELRNHPGLSACLMGEFVFKNAREPMHVYALMHDALAVPKPEQLGSPKAARLHSVAVLPFVNMSGDEENEYFSDGITEELINALVRLPGLRVTSRTSSFAFKGRNEDIREIARTLNVTSILEGSVRKAGKRVRITAQLINSADGYHLFSDTYDRELEDIFAVQDEIAGKISIKLREHIEPSPGEARTAPRHTGNLEAYNLYLKGLYNWYKWSPSAVKRAIRLVEEAIALDPEFARAYAALSSAYVYLGAIGALAPHTAYPKAKENAERAIALDAELGEAHLAIAGVRIFHDWDWQGARSALDRALELIPNSSDAHDLNSIYLMAMKDTAEAMREARIALELNPLALNTHRSYIAALSADRRYDEALEACDRLLEVQPRDPSVEELRGWLYMWKGDHESAMRHFTNFKAQLDSPMKGNTGLGFALGMAGDIDGARECLESTRERALRYPNLDLEIDFVILNAAIGDIDAAFHHMHRAIEKRSGGVVFFGSGPGWDLLQDDPRYDAVFDTVGLPRPSRHGSVADGAR